MHLVMFDIDGTLTATNQVDTDCYAQAIEETLGISNLDTDWSHYKNVTDQACAEEIVERVAGRAAVKEKVALIKARHHELLRNDASTNPAHFRPNAGTIEMLKRVREKGAAIAMATGAWRESALIKLAAANVDADGIALASSDDDETREGIMRAAERRCRERAGVQSFATRTYVGDAIWDLQAAKAMGYEFIGVASGSKAERLRQGGAKWVIPDFSDGDTFFSILNRIWNGQG